MMMLIWIAGLCNSSEIPDRVQITEQWLVTSSGMLFRFKRHRHRKSKDLLNLQFSVK
jgi:hypothetical protein